MESLELQRTDVELGLNGSENWEDAKRRILGKRRKLLLRSSLNRMCFVDPAWSCQPLSQFQTCSRLESMY